MNQKMHLAAVANGRVTVDAIAKLVDRTTRVVSVSAVDFTTGQRRPLAAIGAPLPGKP